MYNKYKYIIHIKYAYIHVFPLERKSYISIRMKELDICTTTQTIRIRYCISFLELP